MLKLILISSLFLASCKSAPVDPDKMCIIYEKRFFNGEFIEVYNPERRCE